MDQGSARIRLDHAVPKQAAHLGDAAHQELQIVVKGREAVCVGMIAARCCDFNSGWMTTTLPSCQGGESVLSQNDR